MPYDMDLNAGIHFFGCDNDRTNLLQIKDYEDHKNKLVNFLGLKNWYL
jgi:hypothetical protein